MARSTSLTTTIARSLDGSVRQFLSMKQQKDAQAAGASVDELERAGAVRWWGKYMSDPPPSDAVDPAILAANDDDDEAYRQGQRDKYRALHDFGDEDEATIEMLVAASAEHRKLERDLKRARLPYRERIEMLRELRQLAADHVDLQKSLGIDRASRTAPTQGDEWLRQYREQLLSGAEYVKSLRARGAEYAARALTVEGIVGDMGHTSGLPETWITAWLAAYDRVQNRPVHPDIAAKIGADEAFSWPSSNGPGSPSPFTV